ncbi:synaptonemal complex protein 1 [Nematolebias whitei]|uniref:synaptonemal complex protein 1 n=1 Tax=Nematolebias whitei TaxID=451745 RepID=UPI0018996F81|nr:synaptonemal complex protein 1 [Nematolebias whitei]
MLGLIDNSKSEVLKLSGSGTPNRMDRSFKFKLLMPPRASNGQVNAVRPQEIAENSGDFLNTTHPGYNLCHNKEQIMPFVNKSVVAPSKPSIQDFPKMKALSPLEKEVNNCNPGELYTKLFDEVEKIKCWKFKVDTDTVQKERSLQDNKRTIETQRQAIQELQFGNESLSIKLEEQISENEDLRNKNNATRNLCNILKETFQWSTDKMHLFESEREETHRLYMENSERIQKLIEEFESLRIRVEADQQEMQKVKEGLLEFEDLKETYKQEHAMKNEEITKLQTKVKDKKEELHKVLFDLNEAQKNCGQLQDLTNQQVELLTSLRAEKESLLQKLYTAEQHCAETEKTQETIAAAMEQSKREYEEIVQSKDLNMLELSRAKIQLAEKLEKTETVLQELKNSHALGTQSAMDLKAQLMTNSDELEKRTKLLEEIKEQTAKQSENIKILEDKLDTRSKAIESFKSKLDVYQVRITELVAELSEKTEEIEMFKIKTQELEGQFSAEIKKNKKFTSEMEQLKRDILQHEVKYEELLVNFGKIQSEKTFGQQEFSGEIQRLEDENQCLRNDVKSIKSKIQGKCQEIEIVQKQIEVKCEDLLEKITQKEKQIKSVEAKLCNLRKKFENKFQVQEEYKKENKLLKKQITKETAKSSHLEVLIDKLQEESQNLKKRKDEECQKLLKDLDSKSTSTANLENEIQKLRLTVAESIRNKEDAEIKCQHKIADMVALMEKHKSQYDRMVEEKDAELNENKNKEMEAVANAKSMEVDLLKQKTENEQLRKQLKTEATEKETLQKELTDLKNELTTAKMKQLSQARSKQSPASNYMWGKGPETLEKYKFDFQTRKPNNSSSAESTAISRKAMSATSRISTPCKTTKKTKHILSGSIKTPGGDTNKLSGTSKIKSYRIKTPPSTEKVSGCWGKHVIELDPKSDSSDHIDLLTRSETPALALSVPQCKLNLLKKIQSPISLYSPGTSSKMAAIKRIRDAGWTAVTGCDKKKKKNDEKIFA